MYVSAILGSALALRTRRLGSAAGDCRKAFWILVLVSLVGLLRVEFLLLFLLLVLPFCPGTGGLHVVCFLQSGGSSRCRAVWLVDLVERSWPS